MAGTGSGSSTGSWTVVNDNGTRREAEADQIRTNGWALYHTSPDLRRKISRRLMEHHAQHVILLLRSHWRPADCVKCLVHRSLSLLQVKQNLAPGLSVSPPAFHVVFDGVSYPDSNVMGDIYERQARDDGVLHGFLVLVDPASNVLVNP